MATEVIVNGQTLPCDFVIMGVGVAPATEFLKNSKGFELEKDGGIKVDEYLRVSGRKSIFAIGDIAVFPQATGEYKRIEHWNVRNPGAMLIFSLTWIQVAANHGRAVGKSISGTLQPFVKIPVFWSARTY